MSISKTDISDAATKAENLVAQASDAVERGVDKAKREAKGAIQATSEKVKSGVDKTAALQRDSAEMTAEAMQVGAQQFNRYRDGVRTFAEKSLQRTTRYAREKPLKSLLIAVSAGAVAMALFGRRSR